MKILTWGTVGSFVIASIGHKYAPQSEWYFYSACIFFALIIIDVVVLAFSSYFLFHREPSDSGISVMVYRNGSDQATIEGAKLSDKARNWGRHIIERGKPNVMPDEQYDGTRVVFQNGKPIDTVDSFYETGAWVERFSKTPIGNRPSSSDMVDYLNGPKRKNRSRLEWKNK